MKILLIAMLTLTLLTSLIFCACSENSDKKECNELDYSKYVECIRKKLRFRRSDDDNDCENNCIENDNCYNNCNDCNCDYCSARTCENFCADCCHSTTCSTISCCHRTCNIQCRTSKCRHECKKECKDDINEKQQQQQQRDISPGNITTIITLHTAVNNTNIITVPDYYQPEVSDKIVVINNTIINNNQSCCNVINQGSCNQTAQWPYINCSYPITYQCGPQCKSPIIHKQPIKSCFNSQCTNQMMHVPQPQPRCIYHPIWPYIACGISQQPFCGGCYHHYYNSPFQQPPDYCSPGCYDEGYGIGPYYRQGPFYRRGFMHIPPCYQIGNCFGDIDYLQFGYYPFGDGNGMPLETVKVETMDKLLTEAAVTNVEQPVTVESYVNYTKALRTWRKLNRATVAIENNTKG